MNPEQEGVEPFANMLQLLGKARSKSPLAWTVYSDHRDGRIVKDRMISMNVRMTILNARMSMMNDSLSNLAMLLKSWGLYVCKPSLTVSCALLLRRDGKTESAACSEDTILKQVPGVRVLWGHDGMQRMEELFLARVVVIEKRCRGPRRNTA